MEERAQKFWVGVMVMSTVLVTVILMLVLGKNPLGRFMHVFNPKQNLTVWFPEARGVAVGTAVRKDGIPVGQVTGLKLVTESTEDATGEVHDSGVLVTIEIAPNLRLKPNEIPRIESDLLGNASVEFSRGAPPVVRSTSTSQTVEAAKPIHGEIGADARDALSNLQHALGEVTVPVKTAASALAAASTELGSASRKIGNLVEDNRKEIEDTIQQARISLHSINDILGDERTRSKLKEAVAGLPTTLESLNKVLEPASKELPDALASLRRTMVNLEKFAGPLGEGGAERVARIDQAIAKLDNLMTEVEQFSRALNDPRGSLGRFTKDPELYNHINNAARNVEELTYQLQPILNDARVFTDKIARHPESLGVRGALQKNPGIK